MQVNLDKNRTNFNGNLYISGLNKKQQKVVEQLRPALDELIKNKKNTNLYIEGSMRPNIIAKGLEEPKYAVMFTQVRTATMPTATSSTSSLKPKRWHILAIISPSLLGLTKMFIFFLSSGSKSPNPH